MLLKSQSLLTRRLQRIFEADAGKGLVARDIGRNRGRSARADITHVKISPVTTTVSSAPSHLSSLIPLGDFPLVKRLKQPLQQRRIISNDGFRREFVDGDRVRLRPLLGCEVKLVFGEQVPVVMLCCGLRERVA